MKSSIRAALALGALALASSQAIASSVSVYNGMTPVSVGTTNLVPGWNPSFYELVVTGTGTVGTVVTLIDSSPEVQTVYYDIFVDLDPTAGILTGALVDSWNFIDILGTPTQAHTAMLAASLAGTQYVLKMASSGLGAGEGSTSQISAVPLPAAAWLFGSALLGLGALRRKQKAGNSEMAVA
jgi:hypothetical protein